MLWYNPTLDQDMPSWVYASWAIGLFLYQTFDAVDGTQAYVNSLNRERVLNKLKSSNAPEWAIGRAIRSWYLRRFVLGNLEINHLGRR